MSENNERARMALRRMIADLVSLTKSRDNLNASIGQLETRIVQAVVEIIPKRPSHDDRYSAEFICEGRLVRVTDSGNLHVVLSDDDFPAV